jgi:hypothetical protein
MDKRVTEMARGDFGMGVEIRRQERFQIVTEAVDSRANIWMVEQAEEIVERLRRVMRNKRSDGLCRNDSLDAR